VFQKGDEALGSSVTFGPHAILATRAGQADPFVGPVAVTFKAFRRHELIVVGTTPKNARIVKILRDLALP